MLYDTSATHLEYPEKTMYRLIAEISAAYPEAPAYEFYGVTTHYRSFLNRIDRAARAFNTAGIGAGDAVTICMPNVPQAIDCFYALDKIGAVANMIHPLSAQNEITFYLTISESRCILTVDLFYEKVKAALKDVPQPVTILVARMQDELPLPLKIAYLAKKGRSYLKFPSRKTDKLWSRFLRDSNLSYTANTGNTSDVPEVPFDRNRTSVILYSGGTSGTPKGICLSDFNMNALAIQARTQIRVPFRPGLSMLSCMPLFHGFGLGINIHAILIHGAECILMPTFNIKTYSDMLIKKRPNFIAGVPTIFEALLHMPQLENHDMSHLLGVFCGGDSLSVELKKKVDAFLKAHNATVQVQEGYGLTECVTASCLTPADGYREGSIGLPFPDMLYAIVRPGTDDILPPNTEGEIILSGPSVMLRYLKNEKETAETLRTLSDGRVWLYTGDLGSMDEDGYVYFRQRIKRMIITNGYNIYPSQIENIIDGCPEVAYSCVIGVRDSRRGQRVEAYVVTRDSARSASEEAEQALKDKIMEELKLRVAAYALPRAIHFRDELPKTLVGKVSYRLLEEEANRAAEACQ